MTRKEAIFELQHHRVSLENVVCAENFVEALEMAIEALSSEPSETSAREWCKQNDYVMMPEAVYEQDITKAYFEGQNIEPCEDAISRQAAIDAAIDGADDWDGGYNPTREEYIKKAINALPSVTPKQKMGRWIYTKAVSTGEIIWSECSVCGEGEHGCAKRMKFCPNCGAKMAESEDKE